MLHAELRQATLFLRAENEIELGVEEQEANEKLMEYGKIIVEARPNGVELRWKRVECETEAAAAASRLG
ncbi:unnamed protein product [Enterobius vermicularis]|uniref:SHSP domain-containing protein n=1 Tax=Enterobius vermicularis TaxID=51028 RepID=A0A158QBE7_ENTVE|nr:unnamed protein product [Enterobius vermicularis]